MVDNIKLNTNIKFGVVDHLIDEKPFQTNLTVQVVRTSSIYLTLLLTTSHFHAWEVSCRTFFYSFSFMKVQTIRPIILASMYKECCQWQPWPIIIICMVVLCSIVLPKWKLCRNEMILYKVIFFSKNFLRICQRTITWFNTSRTLLI